MDKKQQDDYTKLLNIINRHSKTKPTGMPTIEQVRRAGGICNNVGSAGLGGKMSNLADWLETMITLVDFL